MSPSATAVSSPRHEASARDQTSPQASPRDTMDGSWTYDRAYAAFRKIGKPIDRYIFLRDLYDAQPAVYYALLLTHTEEVLPYIYTPTVGEACQKYHALPLKTHGLFLSLNDRGRILEKMRAWPQQAVDVIVVTDGERILGLGDLGTGGMGISEGKITLYTAAAGVHPDRCLPVCLDVGTNNAALRGDARYRGLRQPRATGQEYDSFLEEFMAALKTWRPAALLQFEDFANHNAFHLLERYRDNHCCFNDDIQGTASITLAALLSALRVTGGLLSDQTLLFMGAGEAGTGIAELIAEYLHLRHGLSREDARRRCFFIDSKGLVCKSRLEGLQPHKVPFAHDVPFCRNIQDAVKALKPSILIGVSTIFGAFDEEVIRTMAAHNERPIIFPLSNPTSKSECSFQQAFEWSDGRVLFASGSPYDPLTKDGVTYLPAQSNNAYIFPAMGHAAVLTQCRSLTDEVFVVAAEALSSMTTVQEAAQGRLFPAFQTIRAISKVVMARVAERIVAAGLGTKPEGCGDWEAYCAAAMWSGGAVQPGLSHL